MVSLLLIVSSLASPAPIPLKLNEKWYETELHEYVSKFAEETGIAIEDIRKIAPYGFEEIGWTRALGGPIGRCTWPEPGEVPGQVVFDPNYWRKSAYPIDKEGIVWHEYGHCACDLSHNVEIPDLQPGFFERLLQLIGLSRPRSDLYFADGCPTSLMHPYAPDKECLEKHMPEYKGGIIKACLPFNSYKIKINIK
jgi:hypothetical protein